ncbi:cation diffusion facilitator family transporter [Deinococcus ruber]|uniref:Cadmium transporter n=1 Tax=Deinococcus ruber TaxID=1848197 RepID=A0A918C0P3_9DEIO|nr:cation diffusion facilitator family transporter [Deinococcus ruber]GGR01257.1 cadmium transporter [Deinococcus ruber]
MASGSASNDRAFRQAARLSLISGVLVFAIKLGGYALTLSVGLLSDALESTVNVAAALLLTLTLRFSNRPADADHPYGHAKAEYLSSFLEGLLIGVAGVLIIQASITRLLHPHPVEANLIGLGLTVIASGINLVVGLRLRSQGQLLRSPALIADGQHVLSDVWSSLLVLVGVVLAILAGQHWLDPVIGLLVALLVLRVGWGVVRGAVGGLLDESLPEGDVALVQAAIESHSARYLEFHDLRTRRAGRDVFVDFHLVLPSLLPLREAHDICDAVEESLKRALPGVNVTIHVEPEDLAHSEMTDLRMS